MKYLNRIIIASKSEINKDNKEQEGQFGVHCLWMGLGALCKNRRVGKVFQRSENLQIHCKARRTEEATCYHFLFHTRSH